MKKAAWVFPGQGAQQLGMGVDLLQVPFAQEKLAQAEKILGWSIIDICQNDEEKLNRTLYTQPILYVIATILLDLLKQTGEVPELVAGHSLGEYIALYAAGVFDWETGLKLVQRRAQIMDKVAGGTMGALINFDREKLEELLNQTPDVFLANDNSTIQVVISGTADGVQTVMSQVPAERAVTLKVSGAFHSPLMANAAVEFQELLDNTLFTDAAIPVISNTNPQPTTSATEIKKRLSQQITGSVRWREIALQLHQEGIQEVVEIGPGNTLTKLIKATIPDFQLRNITSIYELPGNRIQPPNLPSQLPKISVTSRNQMEKELIKIWQEILNVKPIAINDNFFDLGGNSLLVTELRNKITQILGLQISSVIVFQYPTIQTLGKYLFSQTQQKNNQQNYNSSLGIEKTASLANNDIAIIGMAGRFPGAENVNQFWQNLCHGVESLTQLSDEELIAVGVPASLLKNPNYVKVSARIPKDEEFDAAFFGYSPREARILDPQQRIYLECAWEALENAGYHPDSGYKIGVYGGVAFSNYLLNNILQDEYLSQSRFHDLSTWTQAMIGNRPDYLATKIAYKLNLTGPAINVQTACSTSLVAVHLACQSLLNGECDIALAGGASLERMPGYLYEEGMMLSPDGHCHAFDASAKGTVFGDGIGIVVLKPLNQAIADGDYIYATIKGSAINNDGSLKVGYTAPGVDGQAQVIATAQEKAGIDPATITYVETHGTGTPLGDPIEIAGLTQAFRTKTDQKKYCAIGSVKSNIGHLKTAAGVTGLIKTALALKHQQIPPSLNFEKSNSEIDFANSPFYVNTKLSPWETNGFPRRAGISSFGFGGTNAHAVLEEWNHNLQKSNIKDENSKQLLVLSAKTPSSLDTATINLASHLQQNPEINLADVAYTLSVGRFPFNHRRIVVVDDLEDAINILNSGDKKRIFTNSGTVKPRSVVFMFSGQGSQYVNMARELYETQTYFREQIDLCCQILQPHLGFDLREVLYPNSEKIAAATAKLTETATTQPALFVIEYAIAKLWMKWGITPTAMIGHSIGEYVAATLAGVFSLEDALELVAARGQLMQSMAPGSMLAVLLPEQEVQPLLAGTSLQIAVINSPSNCVVSGTTPAIEEFAQKLQEQGIEGRKLHTSHAFHSQMMEEILEPFTEKVKQIRLNAPNIPFVSNVTGNWITETEATNPSYYAQHLRQAVRFADGVKQFFDNPEQILLEVGPGRTLSTLFQRHPDKPKEQITLTSLRHPQDEYSDISFIMNSFGQMWLVGLEVDWAAFHSDQHGEQKLYRVPLPTYPFERKRYWIEPSLKVQINTVDKQEFPESVTEITTNIPENKSPYNQTEQAMIKIWQQVLGVDNIGLDDDFFALGGDSLVAVQIFNQIRNKIDPEIHSQLDLSVAQLFKTPNIGEFLATIKDKEAAKPSQSLAMIPRKNKNYARLSYSQQSVWFLHQLKSDRSDYHISRAVNLKGNLQISALQQALDAIVEHHEALRTTFINQDGEPIQIISEPRAVDLLIFDLQNQSPTKEEIQQILERELQKPFDLTGDLMLRGCLVKISPEEHILLLVMHHLGSDGWSVGILTKQLQQLYAAFCKGETSPLKPLTVQYADFAEWQREWLEKGELNKQLEYWKQQLKDANPVLELPSDRPRPLIQRFQGKTTSLTLDKTLTTELKNICSQEKVTLFMTLLSAFSILLSRHSQQEDILVGSPISGRQNSEIQQLIGFFVNTLVLRINLTENPSFKELLQRTRSTALDAYTYQDLPFDKLVEELNIKRDLSRNPLFQVWFNVLNLDNRPLELEGLDVEPMFLSGDVSMFDITLYVQEKKEEIYLKAVYNSELFNDERIVEMLAQFETLLTQIVAAPDKSIHAYSFITSDSQPLLPNPENLLDQPEHQPITNIFSDWAKRTPQQPAIIQNKQTWNYQQLDLASTEISSILTTKIQKGEVVAVSGKRSFGFIASMLAVLKSGGVLLNIDPNLPTNRKELMLAISQAKTLLFVGDEKDNWQKFIETIYISANTGKANREIPTNPITVEISPEDSAYIFFTSGTTGTPKGVLGVHKGLSHFLNWQRTTFDITSQDRAAQLTGLSFDVVLRDIFLPLTSGATLCLPDEDSNLSALQVLPWLEKNQITLMHTVPTIMQSWLMDVPPEISLKHLRLLFSAGEPLTDTLVRQWRSTFPTSGQIVNLYGPTETTLAKCYYIVPEHPLPGVQPVGTPLPQTQCLILTKEHQLCGIGESGEIVFRTPFRTKGYINADSQQSSKFVKNPWGDDDTDLIYYTGDKGRYRLDGTIEILGRIDQQVKIRGVRIEPGEISAILNENPVIKASVVVAREDNPGHKRLVAYVVPTTANVSISELRQFLNQRLPEYMIPSAFVTLDKLPVTANGKIDKRGLPKPKSTAIETENTFIAPRNQLEKQLVEIWQKVLGLERIGIYDNFFELGGHSLIGVRLFAEIEKNLKLQMSLSLLFEAQTVAEMAAIIQKKNVDTEWKYIVNIQLGAGHKLPIFCVHAIWGNTLFYRKLAQYLPKDQPLYGVQAQGLDGQHKPLTSIPKMASNYIQEIRKVQPQGPYYLIGFSIGGPLVLEIAQQLKSQGEEIALLGIIDQPVPNYINTSSDVVQIKTQNTWKRNLSHLNKLFNMKPNQQIQYLWKRIYWHLTAGKASLFYKLYLRYIKDSLNEIRLLEVAKANSYARKNYQPQSYSGLVTLFRAGDTNLKTGYNLYLGWDTIALSGVDIYSVPGAIHTTIMEEPYVQELGKHLSNCLEKLDS